MRLFVQGLDVAARSTISRRELTSLFVSFDKEHQHPSAFDLSRFYFTFDSIYSWPQHGRDLPCLLDTRNNQLRQLESCPPVAHVLCLATDTNFLWCLTSESSISSNNLELLKYSRETLLERIALPSDAHFNSTTAHLDQLVLLATDINVYSLSNSDDGLSCLFELKKRETLSDKLRSEESKLNENAASSLPLGRLLVAQSMQQFATGKEHVLMLATSARVYSFGIGIKGQLGHGRIENSFEPRRVEALAERCIVAIEAGGWHSAALDDKGNCFVWGWNSESQLGLSAQASGESAFVHTPVKVEAGTLLTNRTASNKPDFAHSSKSANSLVLKGPFKRLSLGARHTAFVDDHGRLLACGWNKYKQCHLSETVNCIEPTLVSTSSCDDDDDQSLKVCDVRCGCWSTLFTTES